MRGNTRAGRGGHLEAANLNDPAPLAAFAEYIAVELCADYVLLGEWEAAAARAREALALRRDAALPQIVLPRWSLTRALCHAGEERLAAEDLALTGRF